MIWVKYTTYDHGSQELDNFHGHLSWFSSLKKSFEPIIAGESVWSSLSLIWKEVFIKNKIIYFFNFNVSSLFC